MASWGKVFTEAVTLFKVKKIQQGYHNWFTSVSWSSDVETMATGSTDNTVKMWNL